NFTGGEPWPALGISIKTVAPLRGALSAPTRPPIRSTARRTIANPMPVPVRRGLEVKLKSVLQIAASQGLFRIRSQAARRDLTLGDVCTHFGPSLCAAIGENDTYQGPPHLICLHPFKSNFPPAVVVRSRGRYRKEIKDYASRK